MPIVLRSGSFCISLNLPYIPGFWTAPMPFNPDVKRKIVRDKHGNYLPCVMCGVTYTFPPDAVHIIDEQEWKAIHGCDRQSNGIPLCPNCHRVFDEVLRPRLYRALSEFGVTGLPKSWAVNNKLSDQSSKVDKTAKANSAFAGK